MSSEFSHEFNELLSGELSAVETYDLAIKRGFDTGSKECLESCRASHAKRVDKLTQCVVDCGGTPAAGSGPWGAFAALVEKSAGNAHDALALLEQSEAERLVQYEAATEIVPPVVKAVLVDFLLKEQHETHLLLSTMLKDLPQTA